MIYSFFPMLLKILMIAGLMGAIISCLVGSIYFIEKYVQMLKRATAPQEYVRESCDQSSVIFVLTLNWSLSTRSKCSRPKPYRSKECLKRDEGLFAKDTRRPAFQRMLKDIRAGKMNLILVTDLSRLSRSILNFCILLKDLKK